MAKRIAPSPSSVLNMVKRLRFSMDDLDIYLKPEETTSSDAVVEVSEETRIIEKEKEEADKPSPPIQYQEGFPKLLFQDLQSNKSNVVLNATMELCGMLSGKNSSPEKLHNEFLMLGGHGVLISTMQKWTDHGVIQSNLCRCIASMLSTYSTSTDEEAMDLVSSLLLMGTLDQITRSALMKYPHFPEIQLDAMQAMIQLCGGGHDGDMISASSQQAARRFVRELDGVSLVTKTMRIFQGIEDVQERGCRLLNCLCCAGGHEEATAIKSKALMVVAGSVQAYPDNPNIEKDAHDLMNAVLSGDNHSTSEEELD